MSSPSKFVPLKRRALPEYRVEDPGSIVNIALPNRLRPMLDTLVSRHRVSRAALVSRAIEFMYAHPTVTENWAETVTDVPLSEMPPHPLAEAS